VRTADRIIADGIHLVPSPGRSAALADGQRGDARELRKLLAHGNDKHDRPPIIEATNVARYVDEHPISWGELPSIRPPWPVFWIEYENFTGNERRGVLVTELHDSELDTPTRGLGPTPGSTTSLRKIMTGHLYEGESADDIAHYVSWQCYIEDKRARRVWGPWYMVVTAIDERGRELGNRWWILAPEAVERIIELTRGAEHGENEETWLLSAIAPAMQTVAFLHCRNVATEEHGPPAKLSKAHKRRHGAPMVRWQTVRLEVPRRQGSSDGGGSRDPSALHIVAGHFSHYGDCCPSSHDPKGKLFGRLEGVYWMPSHVRGDPRRGVVLTDRVLDTGTGAPAAVA
jgi:hypothetical protein